MQMIDRTPDPGRTMDKRETLIHTAFRLFYQHGIHAVGINQILQQSGIAKKTLYAYFASKEELVIATIAYRDAIFYDWLKTRLDNFPPGAAALEELFNALDDWFNNRVSQLHDFRGCFFINASAEYHQHAVNRQCASHKARIAELIAQQVHALGLGKAIERELVDGLCLLKEGAIVQAYVNGDMDAAIKAKRSCARLINTV